MSNAQLVLYPADSIPSHLKHCKPYSDCELVFIKVLLSVDLSKPKGNVLYSFDLPKENCINESMSEKNMEINAR